MKREQLQEAAKLLALHDEAVASLERAKTANCFKLEMRQAHVGPDRFEDVGHCAGQSPKQTGSFGQLGTALQAASVAYFEFHRDLVAGQLKALGVDI